MVLALVGDSTMTRASPARLDGRFPAPLPPALAAWGRAFRAFPTVCWDVDLLLVVLLVAMRFRVSIPFIRGSTRARLRNAHGSRIARTKYSNFSVPTGYGHPADCRASWATSPATASAALLSVTTECSARL